MKIFGSKIFGEIAAFVYVIEFKKHGLSYHIFMLIILKHNFKITTPEIIDKYISAEISNPFENQNLHNIGMKHMIHEPCSDWCLVDNVQNTIRKFFLKEREWMKMLIHIIVDKILVKLLNDQVNI